jgi:hypothetical protein
MNDETISVIEAARQLERKKATVFKVMRRLGIVPRKRRDSASKNQMVAYIALDEFQRVKDALAIRGSLEPDGDGLDANADGFISAEIGVFYLIQLEPDHDPLRFKVGFAANLAERHRVLRCAAPFCIVVKTWPCRRLWEKTAIDCVTSGCERLHTEVFRSSEIQAVVERCERFFAMMPPVR